MTDAAEYEALPLNEIGGLWMHAIERDSASEIDALEHELQRRGATVEQAMDAVTASSAED